VAEKPLTVAGILVMLEQMFEAVKGSPTATCHAGMSR